MSLFILHPRMTTTEMLNAEELPLPTGVQSSLKIYLKKALLLA